LVEVDRGSKNHAAASAVARRPTVQAMALNLLLLLLPLGAVISSAALPAKTPAMLEGATVRAAPRCASVQAFRSAAFCWRRVQVAASMEAVDTHVASVVEEEERSTETEALAVAPRRLLCR
jgi:hypothetical protein